MDTFKNWVVSDKFWVVSDKLGTSDIKVFDY